MFEHSNSPEAEIVFKIVVPIEDLEARAKKDEKLDLSLAFLKAIFGPNATAEIISTETCKTPQSTH